MEEEILVSPVPRALDAKSKLFGFELADLLLIFMNLSITNFIFGSTSYRYPLVWGSTLLIAGFLYFVKRGRPDSYLKHIGEFFVKPSYFCAGGSDSNWQVFRKGKKR